MTKDKRVKGCPNPACKKAEKKAKFKAEENYCPICGSELVIVCAKCHGPLDDEGPEHRICDGCEADMHDRKAKITDGAKKIAPALASAGAFAAIAVETIKPLIKK